MAHPGKGTSILNKNQKAAARQLALAAYLLFSAGAGKDEASIRRNLPPYAEIYDSSLGEGEGRDRATDALRKALHRDVEALSAVGVQVEVEGETEGRRYRLPASGFSPAEIDLSGEERAVLVGALRALRRDFPYSRPLRLALANLIGAASAGTDDRSGEESEPPRAVVATRNDEEVARRVATLESAVARRKRVGFDYYAISSGELSHREVEPYALSLLGGTWYMTGRDTHRDALRQFRLSRVRGRITYSTRRERGDFEVPEDFEQHFAGLRAPWQLSKPDQTARIRVTPEAYDAAYRSYGWAISQEAGEEGPILTTGYSGERQLAGWVLSLGEEAKVLSPGSLVDRVERALERLVESHSGDEGETS